MTAGKAPAVRNVTSEIAYLARALKAPSMAAAVSHVNRPGESPDSPGGSVPVSPGLTLAAMAACLSCAELCEAAYRREVLPVWPLVKH